MKTLLSLILNRLHSLEAPLLSQSDAARYPNPEFEQLIRSGILRVAADPDVIPRPGGRPGQRVAVCRTANGYEAVACEGDPFFPPYPLTPEQVQQYEINPLRLLERIRKDNDLIVGNADIADGLQNVGQKRIEGFGCFDVCISYPNYDMSAFRMRCLALAQPRTSKCLAILTPLPVALPPLDAETLESRNIIPIPLLPSADQGHLRIDWDEAVVRRAAPAQTDGAYPRYILLNGRRYGVELTKREMQFLNLALSTDPLPIERVWYRNKDALWNGKYADDRKNRNVLSRFLSDLNANLVAIQPEFPFFFSLQRGEMTIIRTTESPV